MTSKTVLVLGGGVGGLVAANQLRHFLSSEHKVVLVEKNPRHAFAPSFLWLMTGDRKLGQITRNVRDLVRPGIEVIQAEIKQIDVSAQRVETSAKTVPYDYLIIALGSELAPEAIPGLTKDSETFYSLEGAAHLHDALERFQGGTVAVVVSSLPYKCPGAPPEGAMLIADFLRKHGLRGKSELHLFTPESQPMPVAGPELGGAVRQMLESKGIAFHPLHKLAAVDPQKREVIFEGKDSLRYDLLVAIPPHRSPRVIRESELANESGWIPVDRSSLLTRNENVYAIGDVTAIPLPGRWNPGVPLMLPKAGVFAHAQAEVVAHRIAASIKGSKSGTNFCGDGYCMLEAGEDLAGFAFGNFFAEPSPQIQLKKVGRAWHIGKVLLEKWWLTPYGLKRGILEKAIRIGGKAYGIPAVL